MVALVENSKIAGMTEKRSLINHEIIFFNAAKLSTVKHGYFEFQGTSRFSSL